MEWVVSTLHTTSEHGVSSITTADAHTSAASSRLNWRPCRFKGTRPFRRKTKSGFCACAITFQRLSTTWSRWGDQSFKETCCLMTPFNLVAVYHLCVLTVAIYCLHFHRYPIYILHISISVSFTPKCVAVYFSEMLLSPYQIGIREIQFHFSTFTISMALKQIQHKIEQ